MFARSTSLGLLVALAVTSSTPNAQAQQARTRGDDPATVPEISSSDPATRERSRAAFRRGVAQLRAQDWAGARSSFEEAWALVQHPSILLNLGIARLRTAEPVLAEQDLVRFLSEDPGAAQDEVASAREALAEARSRIGTLRIVVTPASASVAIDGKPVAIRTASGGGVVEARLSAGKHVVSAEAEGFRPRRSDVDLPARSETDVRVELVEVDSATKGVVVTRSKSARTVIGWSLVGVSGLALATTGILGLRAVSLADDYSDPTSSSFRNRDAKDEGLTFRTGADIALVTAIVAGAGAAVLLLTDIGAASASGVARVEHRRLLSRPMLFRW